MVVLRWLTRPLQHVTLLVAVACSGALMRNAAHAPDDMLDKVTLMLEEMLAKSRSLKAQADTQYAEVATACATGSAQAQTDIETYSQNVDSLQAYVQQLEADINQQEVDVAQYQLDIERFGQELELAKTQHAEFDRDFARDLAAYDQAIADAQRAQLILRAQVPDARPSGAALAEVASVVSTAKRLRPRTARTGASFLARDGGEYTPDSGGMARDEHLFDEFQGITTATGSYATEVGNVDSVVDNLITVFQAYKTQLLDSKELTVGDYDRRVQELRDMLETSKSSLNLATQTLATKKGSLVAKQQELADMQDSVTTTTAYKAKLDEACAEKAADYKEMSALRNNEIVALSRAIQLLGGSTGTTQLSLVRFGSSPSTSRTSSSDGEEKVLGFLRMQASKLESSSLDRLASQLESFVGAEGAASADPVRSDALAKVRGMIQELITRLQAEAAAETTHHAWCTSELAKNEHALKTAKADIEKHTAEAAQLSAALEKLELELQQINATLARGATDRAALVQERAQNKAENEAAIADAEDSAATVDAALMLLQEYFANASKTLNLIDVRRTAKRAPYAENKLALVRNSVASQSKAAQHQEPSVALPANITQKAVDGPLLEENQGVQAMLQVVRDGYTAIAEKTRAKEDAAARAHVQELQDHDVMIAATTKDQQYKLEMKASYTTALFDSHTDLNASKQALSDATITQEQLKPPCITGETWEERMAKRNEEIAALQEAYQMLEQFSAELGYSSAAAASAMLQFRRAPNTTQPLTAVAAGANSSRPPTPPAVAAQVANATAAKPPPASHPQPPQMLVVYSAGKQASGSSQGGSVVEDVTNLLKEIKAEVESDLAEDLKIYTETKSWCETTIAESEAAIQTLTDRDQELMTLMETSTQSKAQLEVQLARLKDELAKETRSLEEAREIRENQAAKFVENEKELLESIHALSHALVVLSSHYNGTDSRDYAAEREQIAQEKQAIDAAAGVTSLVNIAAEVTQALKSLPSEEMGVLSSVENNQLLQQFLSAPQEALLGSSRERTLSAMSLHSSVADGRSARGEEIYGILQQLLETFKQDLGAARARESSDNTTFVNLRETKKAQVDALVESIALKEEQLAHDSVSNAQAKEDLSYVRQARTAEVEHLMAVQAECRNMEFEFQTRNITRLNEIASLAEAISILEAGAEVQAASTVIDSGGSGAVTVLHALPPQAAALTANLTNTVSPVFPLLAKSSESKPKVTPEKMLDAYLRHHNGTARRVARSPRRTVRPLALRVKAPSAPASVISLRRKFAGAAPPVPPAVLAASRNLAASLATRRGVAALSLSSHALRRKQDPDVNAQLTGFLDRIGKMLDNIRDTLISEKQREVELQQFCINEKHQAESQLARREHDLMTYNATIQRLDAVVSGSGGNVNDLEEQINQLNNSITVAQADRDEQYAAFKTTIAEQEALQGKLHQAIQALQAYYGRSVTAGATFLERQRSQLASHLRNTTKPGGFSKKLEKHQGGLGILAILELLIEESEKLVASIVKAEQTARDAHATNVANTRRAIEENAKQITVLEATGTNADLELQQTQARAEAVQVEMQEIREYLAVVAKNCDYIVAHFTESQAARQAQIDNIRQAKEVFQGLSAQQ